MPDKLRHGSGNPEEKQRGEMEVKGGLVLPDHAEGQKEIEIKFIISELPDDILSKMQSGAADCAVISQGYVNAKRERKQKSEETSAERKETIRLREMWYPAATRDRNKSKYEGNVTHRLTSKGLVDKEAAQAGIISRNEQELGDAEGESVRRQSFQENWAKTEGHRVRKVRYFVKKELVPGQEVTLEIDFFLGHLKGLILTEIEFRSKEEAEKFLTSPDRPTWLMNQVRDIDRYGNAQLARKGLPSEFESFRLQRKVDDLIAELPIAELLDERNRDKTNGLLIDSSNF